MNHHPLHINEWFAENETVHGKNVVVGNLVYSLVLGMSVPDVSGAAIANLEVESLVHRYPTFHGDTIYAESRVLDKVESSSQARPRRRDRRDQGASTSAARRSASSAARSWCGSADAAPPRRRPYGDDVWD